MHLMLKEEKLSPASPPCGLVGHLQTEVWIIKSLSKIPPLPLSFEDSMEHAEVEGTQKVLSSFCESRVFEEDYYPTRHKRVRSCSDMLNFYPSKPKHVKLFETASTNSLLMSNKSITRLYQDWSQEQPQIDGALSLTDIFSWSNKGEIKTFLPTVATRLTKEDKSKEHFLHKQFLKEQKIDQEQ